MTISYTTPTPPTPRTERRMVLRATEVPDDCLRRAQAVIVTESAWHLMAPSPWKLSCLKDVEIPDDVTVPIIDISGLDEKLDQQVAQLIADNATHESGIINMFGLLRGLRRLGAQMYHSSDEYNERPIPF